MTSASLGLWYLPRSRMVKRLTAGTLLKQGSCRLHNARSKAAAVHKFVDLVIFRHWL